MINFDQLEDKVNLLQKQIDILSGKCSLFSEQIASGEQKLIELEDKKLKFSKCVELLVLVEQYNKEKIREGFQSLVTYALRYVTGEDYKFLLEFDRRGNLTEIDFKIVNPQGVEVKDLFDGIGGGILDICSTALRIILMELSKPKVEGFLALDESLKFIHSDRLIENTIKYLKEINKKLNRQIIYVTGIENKDVINLADKAIEIKEK